MNGCYMVQTHLSKGWGGNKLSDTFYDETNPPSILEQTAWPCRFFDFSKSTQAPYPGLDFFNCGLACRPDGDWLVIRRSEHRRDMVYGMNSVMAFKLEGATPTQAAHLPMPAYYPAEHFEDPRAVYFEGRTWVSATNFVWAPHYSGAHQVLVEFDDEWRALKRHDPVYGGNGKHCYDNKRNEKNWAWFFHNNEPHLVYFSQPMMIGRFDLNLQFKEHYQTNSLPWRYGEIRAGSPPVRVGDEYWVFFHSSIGWPTRGTKRYLMGAYAFAAEPPFEMTKITRRPLLSGSPQDRYDHPKPIVVFPCGSVLRYGHWLITFGVNDLSCAFIRIPHSDILELCK